MSAPKEVIEDLLARARSGSETALDELCRTLVPSLCGSADPGQGHDEQIVNAVIAEAKRAFVNFQGETKADAEAWLQGIVRGSWDNPRSLPDAAFETIVPGKTFKPATADEITSRQGESPEVPSNEQTLDPNKTLAGQEQPTTTPARSIAADENIHDARTIAAAADPNATLAPDPNATIAGTASSPSSRIPVKTIGEYEILDTIARGGMGVVYKARQRKLNRIVALKMILAGQFADQADIDRFYVEAEASANLRHPNIVGIHEVGEAEGQHYFSMDYIEGQSLADLVREHALVPRRAAEYVKTIAEAMHYAHEQGILHRDLKPSNVLLDRNNDPLVTDFGLAKRTEGQSQLTMSGTIVGTPAYMPPEQASGKLYLISVRSDVYSLGAILYELLTGRPPFVAANPFETIKQVLENEPVSPRLLNQNVPVDLDTICLKCLQKEPARRYETAQALCDELTRYLAGEPILARPVGIVERSWRLCKRNPRVAISSGLAGFLLLFAAIVFPILYVRAEIAKGETQQALTKAEASIDQMRIAIDELYRIVSEEDLLNEPGLKPVRQKILSQARDLYRQALNRLGDAPGIQQDMAVSLFSLGRILRELEEPEEALEPLLKARQIQERLLAAAPGDIARIHDLGNTVNLIAQVYESQQHLEQALQTLSIAIQLRQDLVNREPQNLEFQRQLINSQMNGGLIHKKMFDLGDDGHFELAMELLQVANVNRAKLLAATNDAKLYFDSAIGSYNLASLMFLTLDGLKGDQAELIDSLNSLGDPKTTAQQDQVASLQQAISDLRSQIAPWQSRIEEQLQSAGERLTALEADDAASQLSGYQRLDQFQIRQLQAYLLLLKSRVTDDEAAAAQAVLQAKQIVDELVEGNRETHEFKGVLAGVYMQIGDVHFERYEDAEAVAAYERAIKLFEELVADVTGAAQYEEQLEAAQARLQEMQDEINKSVDKSEAAAATPSLKPAAAAPAPK